MSEELTRRYDALDGVRALAAYAVMATHVGFEAARSFGPGAVAPWLSRLDLAVPIFLMLSGFLLYRPFLIDKARSGPAPDIARFYWRRALRVLPAYWVTVTVTLALLTTSSTGPATWASYLTLTEIYDGRDHDSSLSQMWTLALEVSFYLILPLLALSLARAKRLAGRQYALLAGMVAASIGWQVLAMHAGSLGYTAAAKWLPGSLDWFAGGMLLALLSVLPGTGERVGRWLKPLLEWAHSPWVCWSLAFVLYWLTTLPLAGPLNLDTPTTWQHLLKHLLQGATVFFMLLPLTLGGASSLSRALGNRVARYLGQISYGVYLWHLPVLILLQRKLNIPVFQGHFWKFFILTAAVSTGLASLSWFGLERPLLRRFSTPAWRNSRPPSITNDRATAHSA